MVKCLYRRFNGNRNGFTLIEMLMGMALAGMTMTAIYSVFITSNRTYRSQENMVEVQQSVRIGIDFMVQDIRMAGLDPLGPATDATDGNGAGIKAATSTQIRFTADMDMDGFIETSEDERITYQLSGSDLQRITDNTENLINNVSTLSFRYLDEDGNTTTTLSNIRRVEITVTCQGLDAMGNTISRTLATTVSCRNLSV